MEKLPSPEDLARMRREFEAARSFEESDDALYALRPEIEPLPQVLAAIVPSKNTNPRLAALQNSRIQGRGSQTPPQRKKSLPRQYNPGTHGAWRPSEAYRGTPDKHASLADAKRVQQQLGQFTQEADELAQTNGFTTQKPVNDQVDEGLEDDWKGISEDQRQLYEQRNQDHEHLERRRPALPSFVPRGPRSDIAVTHSRTGSEDSRSSESVVSGQAAQQEFPGGQWSRDKMVWRATYGGNFTGGA